MHAATTASADWAEFAPPQPRTEPRALGLALLAHGLLLAALAWGVNWRHTDNTLTVEAELWSAIPQQAAPRPETPPPPPPEPAPAPVAKPAAPPPPPPPDPAQRDAEIALARQKQEAEALAAKQKLELAQQRQLTLEAEQKEARKRALEQKRLAQEKLDKDRLKQEADAKKAAQTQAAQEAQREANLRRTMGLAGATGGETSTGSAQRSAGPSASYAGRVAARVRPNIVFTEDIAANPAAEVEVRTSPDGSILSRKLLKSSGNKAWDEAVIKAIDKTDKLPLDTDGRVPSPMVLSFKPKD